MPKFKCKVTFGGHIYVDADDMYEADELVTAMSQEELLEKATIKWAEPDTLEFPTEA